MEKDDQPFNRNLSRRDALKFLGVGSAAFLAAFSNQGIDSVKLRPTPPPKPDCLVRPQLPLGSEFVDDQLNRSDIRSDPVDGAVRKGIPLVLTMLVADVSNRSCKVIEGARVDVWHCDAMGIYSGVPDRAFNTTGQKFLRGYQLTNAKGVVQFQTIYPGWYSGRAVHIHFTIRTQGTNGQNYQFTSQFFFEDTLTDQVHAQEPYSVKGKRDTRNTDDNIFKHGGSQWVFHARGNTISGYRVGMNIGLDLSDTKAGASDLFGGPLT